MILPNAAVLLACGRDPADPATAAALRDALGSVRDWDDLSDLTMRQGMAGLLCRRVSDLCPDAVPPEVLERWRGRAVVVVQRSLRMQRQLLTLVYLLDDAGARAIVYKGPAFSQQLYGDADLRQFVDLDLLVRPGDVIAAHAAALSYGLIDVHPFQAVPQSKRERGEQEFGMLHPKTGLRVELHWRIGPRFAAGSLPADELFARSRRLNLLGREVDGLGATDVLLVLCVHAAAHAWRRVEDVVAVAAALPLLDERDVAQLLAVAGLHGCRRRLHVGALLAHVLTGAPLAARLGASIADDGLGCKLTAEAGAALLATMNGAVDGSDSHLRARLRDVVTQARMFDTPAAMAQNLWSRLFTAGAKDWQAQSADGHGLRAAAATQLRRQRRLWGA